MFKKILSFILILTNFNLIFSFFNTNIKLTSGKSAILSGKGPPLLFSTGLYGTMPRRFYNKLLNDLKKNVTIVTINNFNIMQPDDIDNIVDKLRVDSIAYLSHSSFNPEVLENDKINSAVLLDPICLPKINFVGITRPHANIDYPVLIIRSEKLYNTKNPLPDWQEIEIETSQTITDEIYRDVGHPDILDDFWADIAKNFGFWSMAEQDIMEFKDWRTNLKTDIPMIRKQYRKSTSNKILEFIN
jgi:hypothetical protein